MSLNVVCFSKDRPLQLHGYLVSLFMNCAEPDTTVSVIVATQPEWYQSAYADISAEFPDVEFVWQKYFQQDVADAVDSEADYTMFGCDDVVFTQRFDARDIPSGVIGRSLRLGLHTTRNMFGNPMEQPDIIDEDGTWSVYGQAGDWGYPWEVLGTIYRTGFVQQMVDRIKPTSPSQLEAKGALCWPEMTDSRRLQINREASLVVPTVNLVQTEYPNGIVGSVPLEPGFLLDCWNHDLRLDVVAFQSMTAASWRIADFHLKRI